MNIHELSDTIKRGDKVEVRFVASGWQPWDGRTWHVEWEFRIAPKKEMTLVEELRYYADKDIIPKEITARAADRIEELEKVLNTPLTTNELLDEIKRRMKG